MTYRPRPFALGLIALFAAAPLVLTSLAQATHEGAMPRAKAPETTGRDLATVAPESVGISSERLKRLDVAMKKLADDKQVAGLVTLLERHGKIVDFGAVGLRDVKATEPLQKDSIFRIYSMTKPVTGVAMMMLYEEGKWRLEDPVSRYIPEFARLKVYTGKNDDGSPKLEDARRSMTMRELMTHTAGLGYVLNPNGPVDRMFIDAHVLNDRVPLQTMIDGLANLPLIAQPGARWSYSIAVDVQGYLVEKFSGQPFAEFARARIFEPLGMKDTAFYVPKDKMSRFSEVHTGAGATLSIDPNRPDPTMVPLGPSGGGGLYSTASDYARFCEMLLEGGQWKGVRLLAPRTVEMMRTNHVNPEPLKTMPQGTGWGMDFQVVTDAAAAGESVSTGTFSWFGIAGTWFWIDPVEDLAFVGMVGHQSLQTTRAIQGLSRSLVYQAVTN
ncbi:MAG TPA: serine hydrolase domain-containing protein [Vicinamibacterales bacterium]|jgi:CubicO group peptidase (beta-lactamase class C family)|nr:serine hydrolase domain-containing protein [Vicinamibacterales bacterium]